MSSLKISNNEIIATSLVLILVIKILLIPSYKSTDFDVHRNWLAITKHLPLSEWYFDDVNGKTVHTLDYPPSFAFFESLLVHNPITKLVVERGKLVDERCFELLGDDENQVGLDCVIFQRATVIVADVVFWIGAYAIARTFDYDDNCPAEGGSDGKRYNFKHVLAFLLTISNVGLLLLDHVHFQYNGMMLGVLLCSLAALMKSITISSKPGESNGGYRQMALDLLGAALFAFLLTMKHLYLTLAPVYFFYLLRRFCFTNVSSNARSNAGGSVFSFARLALLGTTVVVTMVLPFLPFVIHSGDERGTVDQMKQIFSRLFPFQRGLCHDYWAGNVWALYFFLEKIAGYTVRIGRRFDGRGGVLGISAQLLQKLHYPFPEITPFMTAVCLFIGLTPAMRCAWRIGNCNNTKLSTRNRQEGILYCIVYSSITSFMLAYHVHEKAIMTAIIPMTYLSFTSVEGSRLFIRLSTIGHFGLLPLLFRPNEFLMKILLSLSYLAISTAILHVAKSESRGAEAPAIMQVGDKCGMFLMGIVLSYAEVIHPLMADGEMEFLPLMLVSITCAIGLMSCWIQCGLILLRF